MRLYSTPLAPNPRRVTLFLAEKGVRDVPVVNVDLMGGEHWKEHFRAVNPLAQVPVLELDDGRVLTESRAICTYLEARYPEPNLMGRTAEDRAFIEMWDRRVEWQLLNAFGMWVRHSHPAFVALEKTQVPDYARLQETRARETAAWLDAELAGRPFIAGERFTIADITAFVAIEFARLVKFKPADAGLAKLQRWRDAVAARPALQA